ncbi:hypothetical protein [Phytoactinopolyspora halophila]|uniref:hypothetical protein n=1 Tax=Phytoactinopolyspora halophila TaxID=1981511 RepID=UPI000F511287|nr:hypothetical protein [Phytoactinopolyspora halophila]
MTGYGLAHGHEIGQRDGTLGYVSGGAALMGLFERVKELFNGGGVETPPDLPLDVEARRAQLAELEDALRALARAMAADRDRMVNPGWAGRVEDLQFAANEAARLGKEGFDRAALHDLAAEVRPLYGTGAVPDEYAAYVDEHERVMTVVEKLRTPLPGEAPADDG